MVDNVLNLQGMLHDVSIVAHFNHKIFLPSRIDRFVGNLSLLAVNVAEFDLKEQQMNHGVSKRRENEHNEGNSRPRKVR
jgi:hypothetical protein